MQTFRLNSTLLDLAKGSVVTIGNFDGVHRGHQMLLYKTRELAKAHDIPSVLLTFQPHPIRILKPDIALPQLSSLRQKIRHIGAAGINFLVIAQFNKAMASLSAREFLEKELLKKLQLKHLVVGHDFHFGKDRMGTIAFLQENQKKYGYQLTVIEPFGEHTEIFSSTLVRRAIQNGELSKAAFILGYPFTIEGRVSQGNQRGSSIGFPTLNLRIKNYVRPPYGVYACIAKHAGKSYKAVANLGVRPTVDGKTEWLEVHLFNFNQMIYGERVDVAFHEFIRPEMKFNDIAELKAQIMKDAITARSKLAKV